MAITDPSDTIQAQTTEYFRQIEARGPIGDVVFKVVGFSVGRGGYNPTDPVHIVPVDPNATTLMDQVYPAFPVAQVNTLTFVAQDALEYQISIAGQNYQYTSGGGATVAQIVAGLKAQINADLTCEATASGSGSLILTGKTPGQVYAVNNPLANPDISISLTTAANAFAAFQSLDMPGDTSVVVYNCRLPATPVASNADYGLGEIGLWGQILQSKSNPAEIGTYFLMAIAHTPIRAKTNRDVILFRVVVNY
jgi:hypothetical protein